MSRWINTKEAGITEGRETAPVIGEHRAKEILAPNEPKSSCPKTDICIVKLPRDKSYAIITPGKIFYKFNISGTELSKYTKKIEKTIKLRQKRQNIRKTINRTVAISLIPTFDCNLRCVYCYARGGETKETMPLWMAKTAISSLTKFPKKTYLDLFLMGGGEPLLHFELVKKIVDFAEGLYKTVKIYVVTNGTFNKHILDWLIQHKIIVRVSYDGIMQNQQRLDAHEGKTDRIVRANIKRLIACGLSPVIQCVVTKEGLPFLRKTVSEIARLGVKTIKIEPVLATDISRSGKELEPDPVEYARALLDIINFVVKSKLDIEIDTGYFAEPATGYYCGMPAYNRIITPEGLITACVEVSRKTDPYSNLIIYGKVTDKGLQTDKQKCKKLENLHFKKQIGGCRKCNLRLICQGGCPMSNIWKSGLPLRKSLFTCAVEHELLPKLLLKMTENPHIVQIITNNAKIKFC